MCVVPHRPLNYSCTKKVFGNLKNYVWRAEKTYVKSDFRFNSCTKIDINAMKNTHIRDDIFCVWHSFQDHYLKIIHITTIWNEKNLEMCVNNCGNNTSHSGLQSKKMGQKASSKVQAVDSRMNMYDEFDESDNDEYTQLKLKCLCFFFLWFFENSILYKQHIASQRRYDCVMVFTKGNDKPWKAPHCDSTRYHVYQYFCVLICKNKKKRK